MFALPLRVTLLQDTAQLVLRNCVTTAAAKLQAASTAVRKLRPAALEEGITDLEGETPQDAPDALVSLHSSLRRCQVLLQAGAKDLASSKQLHSTCTVRVLRVGVCWAWCVCMVCLLYSLRSANSDMKPQLCHASFCLLQ